MKRVFVCSTVLFGLALSACTQHDTSNPESKNVNSVIKTAHPMKNLISIVELPTHDFARAVSFYQTILDVTIEEVNMGGTLMGVLPSDGETVSMVLVKGKDYTPTATGAVVYLNAGNDLQPTLDKVVKNGGQLVVPKTEISPDMGYFALFIDTEGNKVGLHSKK
ncbi:MAG TPA: VOC family protein [Cytophagales bacterium]|nr:VOC family protein [Cytophagales bacterium]